MTNWLSNKWNLIGIYALCSILIGSILYGRLTFTELIIIYILTSTMSITIYVLGVGRGMFLSTLMRQEIDGFLEGFREQMKKNNKKIDEK